MKLNIICYFAQNNKSIIILGLYFRFSSTNSDLQSSLRAIEKTAPMARGDAFLEIFYFLHASHLLIYCWLILVSVF